MWTKILSLFTNPCAFLELDAFLLGSVFHVYFVPPPPDLKSAASILTWLKRRKGLSTDIISDLTQLEKFIDEDELVVLGLFKVM